MQFSLLHELGSRSILPILFSRLLRTSAAYSGLSDFVKEPAPGEPDPLGKPTTFPPFYGTGMKVKVKGLSAKKAKRVKVPSSTVRWLGIRADLDAYVAQGRRFRQDIDCSRRIAGWEEVAEDIHHGVGLEALSQHDSAAWPPTSVHRGPAQAALRQAETLSAASQELTAVLESRERLFAVIYFGGHQFKVTRDDLFITMGHLEPDIGTEITINKVLLVGSRNLSLLGLPLLRQDQVTVKAIVVEKTLSHTYAWFYWRPRKDLRKHRDYRYPLTVLRITDIALSPELES